MTTAISFPFTEEGICAEIAQKTSQNFICLAKLLIEEISTSETHPRLVKDRLLKVKTKIIKMEEGMEKLSIVVLCTDPHVPHAQRISALEQARKITGWMLYETNLIEEEICLLKGILDKITQEERKEEMIQELKWEHELLEIEIRVGATLMKKAIIQDQELDQGLARLERELVFD